MGDESANDTAIMLTDANMSSSSVHPRSRDGTDASLIPTLASRHSYESSPLSLDARSGRPLNPLGRTGISGRGKLYNWGPNHAADPLVTRDSITSPGDIEVVVIRRGDTGTWAFPGGMVDPGEEPAQTLRREFEEEALNVAPSERERANRIADDVFRPTAATFVYSGYVDDPRNTDNAVRWMEERATRGERRSDAADSL